MAIEKGYSLKHLVDRRLDPKSTADEYTMDISLSVYKRMKELGLKQKDLAERMGVKESRVSRILSGDHGINLETMAKLEDALDINITYGFREPRRNYANDYKKLVADNNPATKLYERHGANLQDLKVVAV